VRHLFLKAAKKSSIPVYWVISPVIGPSCLSAERPLLRVISRTFATLKNAASCQPSVRCGACGSTQPMMQ
jgi:hypothetical protein